MRFLSSRGRMMAEDGGNISEDHQLREAEGSSSLPTTFIRLNDLSGGGERSELESDGGERRESAAGAAAEEASAGGGEPLPHPTLAPVVFFYLKQTTRPRSWCLKMVCNPYPFKLKCKSFASPGWHSPVQVGRATANAAGRCLRFENNEFDTILVNNSGFIKLSSLEMR